MAQIVSGFEVEIIPLIKIRFNLLKYDLLVIITHMIIHFKALNMLS